MIGRRHAAVAVAAAAVAATAPGATSAQRIQEPGRALLAFVDAAREGRVDLMWRQLSPESQERLGPYTYFRARAGRRLRARLRGFGPTVRLILDERITGRIGVAAVAGIRRTTGGRRFDAYAAAAKRNGNRWGLELGSPIRVRAVRPQPRERVVLRTQLAAGVAAHSPIEEAGLWFDGIAVPARGGVTDPRNLTMWDEAPQPLAVGHHTVVAFASAGGTASAIAWTFFVVPTA